MQRVYFTICIDLMRMATRAHLYIDPAYDDGKVSHIDVLQSQRVTDRTNFQQCTPEILTFQLIQLVITLVKSHIRCVVGCRACHNIVHGISAVFFSESCRLDWFYVTTQTEFEIVQRMIKQVHVFWFWIRFMFQIHCIINIIYRPQIHFSEIQSGRRRIVP